MNSYPYLMSLAVPTVLFGSVALLGRWLGFKDSRKNLPTKMPEQSDLRLLKSDLEWAFKKTEFVTPFFQKFPTRLGLDYRFFWILFSEYLFALYVLAVYQYKESPSLIAAMFVVSILNFFTPIAHVRSSEVLERFYEPISKVVKVDDDEFSDWFKRQMGVLYYSRQNLACSLTGAALFLISAYLIHGLPYRSMVVNGTFYLNVLAIGLMGGPLFRFIVMSAVFVLKLSRFPLSIYIYNHPSASVKLIGRLLLNFAICYAAPAYFLCVIIAILVSPIKTTQMVWIVAGALIVLSYFVLPQWSLHKTMYTRKQQLMHSVSVAADKVISEWIGDPVPEKLSQFTGLCELQEKIAKMEEWPFNASWLASLLTTLIIPLVLAILQLGFDLILKKPGS